MTVAPKSAPSRIEGASVSACTIPTDFPESDGTLEWSETTIVLVEIRSQGQTGLGYSYADATAGKIIERHLAPIVKGRDPMDVAGCWASMVQAVRNIGRPGIASAAISAVDIALWDLKAKLLRLPLVKLLGAVRDSIPVYGSGGFTSYSTEQLQTQLSKWIDSGIGMVKMKIGRSPDDDPHRVHKAREAIGAQARLFVDANGAYSRKQALGLATQFADERVSWFEEPVSSDDLDGLRLVRDRAPAGMEIAAGEYGYDSNYFWRMLEAGAVDVLQADATRCGGVTGFLQASALCAARSMPLSAHTAPAIHMPLCCAAPNAVHLEYFHDHLRIEGMLFDGVEKPRHGELIPDLTRLGIGLDIRRDVAARYAVR